MIVVQIASYESHDVQSAFENFS